jgi:hypothetical protein
VRRSRWWEPRGGARLRVSRNVRNLCEDDLSLRLWDGAFGGRLWRWSPDQERIDQQAILGLVLCQWITISLYRKSYMRDNTHVLRGGTLHSVEMRMKAREIRIGDVILGLYRSTL